jgi:BirA family biotin operon repressor/biotin-[acetyl-CoA-carboxylase] ligase
MGADSGVLPGDVKRKLETVVFGRRIYYLPEVDSTNRLAADLARLGEASGTLVISDHQTRGRGRFERSWLSPPRRNLLFSLILRSGGQTAAVLPLSLAFSAAVAEALAGILGTDVGVKWPNDVSVAGGKICGILAESVTRKASLIHVIVGFGINVNAGPEDVPSELRPAVTSCRAVKGEELNRAEVLAGVLSRLENAFDRFLHAGFAPFIDSYQERLTLMGARVSFDTHGVGLSGIVEGVQEDGGLRIGLLGGGRRVIYNETITVDRSPGG